MPVFSLTAIKQEQQGQTTEQPKEPVVKEQNKEDQKKQFKVVIDGPLSQIITTTLVEMFQKDKAMDVSQETFMQPLMTELGELHFPDERPDLYVYAVDGDSMSLAEAKQAIDTLESVSDNQYVQEVALERILAIECNSMNRYASIVTEYAHNSGIRTVFKQKRAVSIVQEKFKL